MKEFTKEMLKKLHDANDALRGTPDYMKYHMECYMKDRNANNARWKFYGWTIPHKEGVIKTIKGTTCIVCEFSGMFAQYNERYFISDEVKELLGI